MLDLTAVGAHGTHGAHGAIAITLEPIGRGIGGTAQTMRPRVHAVHWLSKVQFAKHVASSSSRLKNFLRQNSVIQLT